MTLVGLKKDYIVTVTTSAKAINSTFVGNTGAESYASVSDDATTYTYRMKADGDLNLLVENGGGIYSIKVVQSDEEISTANYTINYKLDGTVIATKNGSTMVGDKVEAESSITVNDQKYFAVDDAKTSLTVTSTEADNVLNVAVRKANEYSYTVKNSFDDTIAIGKSIEGEAVKVGYPHYILQDGTLYSKGATNKEYNVSFTPDADNYTYSLTGYDETSTHNVVYYSEAEDIDGLTINTYGNVAARASKALAALAAEDTKITSLPAGKYIIHAGVFSSAMSPNYTIKIKVGETTLETPVNKINASEVALTEVELKEDADVTLLAEGMGQNCLLDYILIEKTAETIALNDNYFHSTYCPESDLDFTDVTGVEVYKVKVEGNKAVSTKVEGKIQAGEGILLKKIGNATSVTVPTTTGAEKLTDNDLVGAEEDITSGWDSMNAYMLVSDTQFQKIGTGTLAKGKAYLLVSDNVATKNLSIYFGDEVNSDDPVTAINGVADNADAQNGAIYTLQGVKVEKAEKGGIYIINGKKYIK